MKRLHQRYRSRRLNSNCLELREWFGPSLRVGFAQFQECAARIRGRSTSSTVRNFGITVSGVPQITCIARKGTPWLGLRILGTAVEILQPSLYECGGRRAVDYSPKTRQEE